MKVSIVIPVYNVKNYLYQCVESITSQNYGDIEIILVDDGSNDGSETLCDRLSQNDPRIKCIHKKNGGAASARNVGVNEAIGQYLLFVDGDDFWRDNTFLKKIMQIALENSDCNFINFNCSYYYPDLELFIDWKKYSPELLVSSDKNFVLSKLVQSGTVPMSPCLRLIKRDFYMENAIRFPEGTIAEDIPWFLDLMEASKKTMSINEYVYAYRQNVSGSVTNTSNFESFQNLFEIFKKELAKVDNRSFNDEAKAAIRSFLAYEYCILLTYKCSKEDRKELWTYKDVLRYTMNPKVKMVSWVYSLFGIRVTEWVLKLYLQKRKVKK